MSTRHRPRDTNLSARINLQNVKARTSMVALVGRDVKLRKRGADQWGLCPIHAEKSPSFKVSETRRAFKCFGCGVSGDVLDYLRLVHGMELSEALEYLAVEAGLTPDREGRNPPVRQSIAPPTVHDDSDQDEQRRIDFARHIWREARALSDTPAEVYLRERGLRPSPEGWPPSLRYHPALKHGPTGLRLPALVGGITIWPDRHVVAIHRTFITADGTRKAPVSQNRMMLGRCAGGAVRLAPAGSELVIAEGIETAFSVQQATGKPAWAALSTSGIKAVALPTEVRTIIIAADGDDPGEKAAQEAARRFVAEGRTAKIARPPIGMDFNDLLKLPSNVAVISDQRRRANG